MKLAPSRGPAKYIATFMGTYTGFNLFSRVGTTPPADANCAGDRQPLWVARAFSLSTLRQQLLQHAANVSAHFSVTRALRSFAVAHRSSPLSTAAVIAAGGASVTVHS